MESTRHDVLQSMCRSYLSALRPFAARHGLSEFLDFTIEMNEQKRCAATESEVELLSRAVDDERVSRVEIPEILGCSYRKCEESGLFDRIRRLRRVGIYSKISVLLLKAETEFLQGGVKND